MTENPSRTSALHILEQDRVWDGHFKLDMIRLVFNRRSGSSQEITREVLFASDSSAILLYNPARRTIILTKQLRVPPFLMEHKSAFIEACAGNIDDEEKENTVSMEEAARIAALREAEEETGWKIQKLDFLFSLYSCPGLLTERIYYFLAEVSEQIGPGGGVEHEGEDIDAMEIPLSQAWKMVESGLIEDAKTVILLQQAIMRNWGQ